MGEGYMWECPKCKYKFRANVGMGFSYWDVYAKTFEKARLGGFGKELKETLKNHPNAVIDPTDGVYRCTSCGELAAEPILTVYIPKGEEQCATASVRSVAKAYMTPNEMEWYFDLRVEYNHRCKRCGGRMVTVHIKFEEKKDGLLCPDCKTPLRRTSSIEWD